MVDLDDVTPRERSRAAAAAARYTLRRITDPADPAFDDAWDLLASYFRDRGELEDADVLRSFVGQDVIPYDATADGTYVFVVACDGDRLVGVRDFYVDVDHATGVCVAALAHTLVAEDHRRTGLASLLRAVPVTLTRQELVRRFGRALPTLVSCEMEPPTADAPDTVVRLIAYGRSGFGVLDPTRLSYCQPDLRPHVDGGVPLLAVVRPIDVDVPVPVDVAVAYPRLFHACHRTYLPRARVDACERHARAVLGASDAPVALLPLPTSPAEIDRLAPLVPGAVLPRYPDALRGAATWGDPAAELDALRARWLTAG